MSSASRLETENGFKISGDVGTHSVVVECNDSLASSRKG
jgi:hypothetical protein